ncbi:hypothetical protein FS749_006237 [Ceratobasidium sp. UAMH 11750]|nr:hypothetical protein FS749_006237 [Ceratobasidium sp. UAMH 11750]
MVSGIHPRMDMPGMGGSGSSNLTDSSFPHMCSMNMLWNWEVFDSCFISAQWHVRSEVGFAFSIISIFLIAFLIEGTRRSARNYDRMLTAKHAASNKEAGSGPLRPTLNEQLIRGAFYGVQFSAAYLLMLIAMSYKWVYSLDSIWDRTADISSSAASQSLPSSLEGRRAILFLGPTR